MDIKSRSLDTYVEIFNKYSDDVTLVRELDVDDYDKGKEFKFLHKTLKDYSFGLYY